MPTLYFLTNCQVKGAQSYEKKSEKLNICTFCLSKMCKLLGVWAVAWLLSIKVSRFTFRSRGFSKPLLHPAYVFQSIKSFTWRSYLNSTLFKIALQESLSLLFVFLKLYTCTITGFSCSLAISNSSLFGLYLGRETFQKPFYTWLTFSKISSQNKKPHKLLHKAKQSQERKRLKLVNVI